MKQLQQTRLAEEKARAEAAQKTAQLHPKSVNSAANGFVFSTAEIERPAAARQPAETDLPTAAQAA